MAFLFCNTGIPAEEEECYEEQVMSVLVSETVEPI